MKTTSKKSEKSPELSAYLRQRRAQERKERQQKSRYARLMQDIEIKALKAENKALRLQIERLKKEVK